MGSFFNGLLPFGVFVGVVAVLVELQPDLGTTAIIVGTAACVFFVAGANLVHISLLSAGGVAVAMWLMAHLSGYRLERIRAFLDPWSDVQGSGWHTAQGLIALGSGGLFGHGLGNGLHKYYWVPNAHTDAIFNIIGEELGFVGCLGVLGLFGILGWRGFLIAWHAPDGFGRLLATGLTCLITLQALLNIAVVTNSLPYTGITLPLVSYRRLVDGDHADRDRHAAEHLALCGHGVRDRRRRSSPKPTPTTPATTAESHPRRPHRHVAQDAAASACRRRDGD